MESSHRFLPGRTLQSIRGKEQINDLTKE